MALTSEDCACIHAIWPHLSAHPDKYGAEALYRMFLCEPQTKTYFAGFDFHKDSPQIKGHGKKVFDALTKASKHLDNIDGALCDLSELHATNMRVDPGNFSLLAHHILVVCAIHFPDKFDCHTHQAVDKFLANVSCVLTSRYR
ncbi:hemoglobin subunit alpha-2-like [Bufo gargarizans]|uniref:hemoglobin subunit alpha-2-like n=1 Tax=Bufo gargarizans TaxID=30331 RepID=UPI001CF2D4D8|nr:hemoglobin subunit alpha-2-like [Bufo gargarizans]